ncbi:helix-turn-helix transcriptional regulator [Pedobacter psychroterrae]|uniref:AraC family transcriptional regulator n=1 Tax=Pedobacter psychroterrae TaxID=2530453 RepID=A0A4R0NKN3_9SPHI|nr:AraC family transcriptional regulator [Pedobacter psychroterrae]TCD01146.1 AraC family transcriptional regulator [Pedobacter psychroterrae]
MSLSRIVVNKNEIVSESTYDAHYRDLTGKYAINIVSSGQASYTIGKRQLTLFPGSFIFLNHDTSYSNKIDSAVQVNTFSVLFDPDFVRDFEYSVVAKTSTLLDRFASDKNGKPLFVESIYPLQGDMRFTLSHLKKHIDNGMDDQLLLSEYLHHCLLNYYDLYHSEVTDREASLKFLNKSTKSEILKRLSIAKDYIISNYNKNIHLEDIAQMACLSVNHLLRTFKQAYHQSPHQFLTNFRLQQAKYYLKNTDYPINEIVDIVGFECPSSFIRLFKNSFKITPGKYR